MLLKNTYVESLLQMSEDKSLICFGAGQALMNLCNDFRYNSFFKKIELIADNNVDKQNTGFCFDGNHMPVNSIESCLDLALKEPLILITASDSDTILGQLDSIPRLNNCDCYVYSFVRNLPAPYKLPERAGGTSTMKIPKIIHYCWFGGNPIPEQFLGYIETWKRFCSDYEIVRWDESNYDVEKNRYMSEAYQCERWGFVPDYARLDIIYKHGGVYLDTDVELVRNIDYLLYDEGFCGFEDRKTVAFGLGFGAAPGFPLIKEILDIYENISFFNADGSMNLTPSPIYQTQALYRNGLIKNNSLQEVKGMKVYPTDVFSPITPAGIMEPTENTFSMHWYAATWVDESKLDIRNHYWIKNRYLYDRIKTGVSGQQFNGGNVQ